MMRDYKTVVFQLIFPIGLILLSMFLMRLTFIKDLPEQTLNLDVFQDELPLTIPIATNISAGIDEFLNHISPENEGKLIVVNSSYYDNATSFDSQMLYPHKYGGWLKGGIFCSSDNTTMSDYMILNTRSPTSFLVFPTLFAQAYINSQFRNNITITVINSPLPLTHQALQINNAVSGFLGAFVFSMALAFKFASVIAFLVKERSEGCKHHQIVAGMSVSAYWVGNFLLDFGTYIVVGALAAGLCQIFEVKSLIEGDALASTWLLFMFYGLTNTFFTYLCTFIFEDYGNAQAMFYFFNFAMGGLISTAVLVLRIINVRTALIGRGLAWLLRFIPAFSFGEGLLNEGTKQILEIREKTTYTLFDPQIALAPILYLGIEAVILPVILFLVEFLKDNEKFLRLIQKRANT